MKTTKKKINKISKKELLTRYRDFMTVGSLKEFIEKYNVPDTAKILVQRVEDKYYDGVDISGFSGCDTTKNGIYPKGSKASGWGVYLKPGYWHGSHERMNKKMLQEIKRRKAGKKPQFPKIKDPKKYMVGLTDDLKEQYHPAWCCVGYKDDIKDFLFIDLHY